MMPVVAQRSSGPELGAQQRKSQSSPTPLRPALVKLFARETSRSARPALVLRLGSPDDHVPLREHALWPARMDLDGAAAAEPWLTFVDFPASDR